MAERRFPVIWLTGNTGAGKSTLATGVQQYFNECADCRASGNRRVVILDGDEMRASISRDEGLSPEDRRKHNLRVARLAHVLHEQGFLVLVAVIAPFASVREEVQVLCDPKWVYVKRSGLGAADKPYEPPASPDCVIDNDTLSIEEARSLFIAYLEREIMAVHAPLRSAHAR